MIIYLAGAINGCTDSECKDWREEAKQKWGGDTLDPMRRDYRGREDECVDEIVELDKRDIDDCDAVLVMYQKPSVGTSMEVFYAWQIGRPVAVVNKSDAPLSPWIRYHATMIVPTLDDALARLHEAPRWDWIAFRRRAEIAGGARRDGGVNSVGVPADALLYLIKRACVPSVHSPDSYHAEEE